ncbi:MAG TPA: thioesterase family protein [Steroidobacteraceae bacterium]
MSTERFKYYLRVRYNECDAQKVVFNSRYGDYVDLATGEFLRSLGYGNEIQTGDFDYQLVKQTIEWRAPARFDQVLEISVAAKHIGTTSFTFTTEFRIAGTEPVIATAETVYVHVDTHTLKKQPIPDAMREAFLRGAPGVVVDHAAYLSKR